MSLKDAAARLKSRAKDPEPPKEMDWAESYRLRARMLGVLLRDARQNAERSIDECARLLRVDPATIESWEYGESAPSLPQVELLAFYLGVPVSHFWGMDTLESRYGRHTDIQTEYVALRDRMIGALLRQARDEVGLSIEQLAHECALPAEALRAYELGETAVPMNELTVIANVVRKNVNYFLETSGYIGDWLARREQWKQFTDLPEDIRRFVSNPLNLGFIDIALMLSQMPADRLRRIGESVLNITL